MDPVSDEPHGIAFGRFRLSPHRRELLADGKPVAVGRRAFDVLMALIEAHGAVISKYQLMARVWPGQAVEENNLQVQISLLRAAFGPDRELIRTVSRRGYQFTGDIRFLRDHAEEHAGTRLAAPRPRLNLPPTNLPEPVSELIGREEEISEILNLATAHRLVTLTGGGGIGKTRIALALARELLPHFAEGVWLVEFSPITDPGFVPATLVTAAGLDLAGGEISAQRVAQMLAGRTLLLVLDTCEHVISEAAALADAILRVSSAVRIIATSREPLRADGEWIYPVPPLSVPTADAGTDADPLAYGAVRLFVDRVRASQPHFAPDQRSMDVIAAICRRLDGIPLAIELAAARAAALGIEEVGTGLDDRFRLLTGGRRTALPRHQTLRSTLDWSHDLLPELERVTLRRLAVFADAFELEAAAAVVADEELVPSQAVDCLLNLVAKSLVVADLGNVPVRYRLLDTMRAYAFERLGESGERHAVARRHAEYFRDLFERAEVEWETRATTDWLFAYAGQIDNLRAALDWAFSPHGDAALGVALTTAGVPLWMGLPLLQECRGHVELALAVLVAATSADSRPEMKLRAALGVSLAYTGGAVPEIEAAWVKALHLAEGVGDVDYQLRALWGLWGVQDREALGRAQQFASVAATPADRLVGERMIGNSYHFLGDQCRARRQFERVIADDVKAEPGSRIGRFQVDNRPSAQAFLARVLWLQGFPEQATRTADETIEQLYAANQANTLCQAVARAACPIALWTGNLDLAEKYIELMRDCSTTHALTVWQAFSCAYEGVLFIQRGDLTDGIRLIRTGFHQLDTAFSGYRVLMFLSELAEALGRAGQASEGLATVNEAIDRSERVAEGWILPELLRLKGELLLLRGEDAAGTDVEDNFRQSLNLARRQGALSWELRAAASWARQLSRKRQSGKAKTLLQPVYDRFTEGFDTADLKEAKALLDALA